MPSIFKILLIVLLAVISFRLSASIDGKKSANDRNGKNSSAGIGTKIKRIVTAGLLFTSLAMGGTEAIGRNNAQGAIAAGVMAPPPPPANFEKATPVEKMRTQLHELSERMLLNKAPERVVPGGPNPLHH
ncbi:hypothetical protein niasHT_033578 [Heterodera trifolii]|uniref:Uncharacterized protein n=1 Tax=Heterodera trifolii TaxID=157864 RepID=A0ABD2IA88_9BILA